VQSQCRLWLALTDGPSLEALVPLLPWQQLVHLDLNMICLASAAAPDISMLVQAAIRQLAARANALDVHQVQGATWDGSSSSSSISGGHKIGRAAAASSCQSIDAQQQRQPWHQEGFNDFTVGLWISNYLGATGLPAQNAIDIWQKLRSVGCQLSNCSHIQCYGPSDLQPLGQLVGLKGLGLKFYGHVTQQQPDGSAASHQEGLDPWQHTIAALDAVTELKESLEELTIDGCCPPGSSSGPCIAQLDQLQLCQAEAEVQTQHWQHPFASLAGLTKLALLKQWTGTPVTLCPLASLTSLQELVVECEEVNSCTELCCLGNLQQLKVLRLFLRKDARTILASRQSSRPKEQPGGQQEPASSSPSSAAAAMPAAAPAAAATAAAMTGAMTGATVNSMGHCCACCCQGSSVENISLKDAVMLVSSCPCAQDINCPVLLDWSWLKLLQQLEKVWLRVPHLDLACLPSRLVELEMRPLDEMTEVSLTINGGSWRDDGASSSHSYMCKSSSSGSSAQLHLPRLKELTLAHPLVLAKRTWSADTAFIMRAAAVADDGDDGGAGNGGEGRSQDILQMHHNSLLLLALAAGCPELRILDLVRWLLPTDIIVTAVRQLRHLSRLFMCPPDIVEEEQLKQQLATLVRAVPVHVHLLEP
jgi:hypothetical protein